MASKILFVALALLSLAALAKSQCPRCSSEEAYLCGRDPVTGEIKTFRNSCLMWSDNCFRPTKYVKIYDGECLTCAVKCAANSPGPICVRSWTTGVTRIFDNECALTKYNCEHRTDLETVSKKNCLSCNEPCGIVNKAPICGQDPTGEYILFGNICELIKYNCEHKKNFVKVGDIVCPRPLE